MPSDSGESESQHCSMDVVIYRSEMGFSDLRGYDYQASLNLGTPGLRVCERWHRCMASSFHITYNNKFKCTRLL